MLDVSFDGITECFRLKLFPLKISICQTANESIWKPKFEGEDNNIEPVFWFMSYVFLFMSSYTKSTM